MVDPAAARFLVSWQDEGEKRALEDDEVRGAEAAIAWGRERSPVVWIRLGNRGDTYFSAGDEHPADNDADEFVPHWPPDGPPAEGWWALPPIPHLSEVEAMAADVRSGELEAGEAARWADERLAALVRADDEVDKKTLAALIALRGDDPGFGPS